MAVEQKQTSTSKTSTRKTETEAKKTPWTSQVERDADKNVVRDEHGNVISGTTAPSDKS